MAHFHSNALIGAGGQGGAAGFQIDRSLRFNSGDSSYLSRSQGSGNSRTFTYSFWVKAPVSGTWPCIIGADSSSNERAHFRWNGDQLQCYFVSGGSQVLNLQPNRRFRDPAAWYHIVLAFDSTQNNSSDRAKLYVNGAQETSFAYSVYPSLNATVPINNSSSTAVIGRRNYDSSNYSSGYLAEVHFVDGQALAATDFGEEDSNGVWQPIEFAGAYDQKSGGRTIANSTGAVPILNTSDADGQTVSSGVRSDSNSSSIVLALPLNGSNGGTTITDYHHTIKGSGSAKAVSIYTGSASGGAVTSTAVSKYYGSSFYVVRGATNNYTASDYIYRTGDSDLDLGTGSFCVEFWYYPTAFQSNCVIFDNRHESNSWPTSANGFSIVTTGNGSIFTYSGGNQIINHSTKLTLNAWNHIAYTRDGSTERLFVNGDFFSTTASSSRNYNEGRFHLGSAANNGEGSDGYYQDLRIYKGVAKYTSNFNVPELGVGGVNSFYLKFDDNSSAAALGTDSSGLSNTWTVNNLSVASGSGNDSLIDTPTDYEADSGNNGGNYATLNPVMADSQGTLSNGNLELTGGSGTFHGFSTIGVSSGKWYAEVTGLTGGGASNYLAGIADLTQLNGSNVFDAFSRGYGYRNDAKKINNNTAANYGATYTTSDVIGVAADLDAGTITFYKNGTSQGTAYTGISSGVTYHFAHFCRNSSDKVAWNFGQRPFAISSVPTGYKSLCTQNLPDPTIADGSTAMSATLWTGNGSTQTISGLNHSPDFIWHKLRSITGGHQLYDSVRGTSKRLQSDSTAAESTLNGVTAFNSDGWTMTAGNNNNESYVSWTWDAGSSNTSITAGSLNSSAYNTSDKWSDDVAGNTYGGASMPKSTMFNGALNTNVIANSGTTLTFSPSGLSSISSLRIYGSSYTANANGIVVNGTDYTSSFPQGGNSVAAWVTIPETSLTSVAWSTTSSGLENGSLWAIEVDGKLLVDNDQTPPNVPSIASTVRANASAGFSIVSYTADANSSQTIGHGLNAKPGFIIVKDRDASSHWSVYHQSLNITGGQYLKLSDTSAASTSNSQYNSTEATTSVFTVGSGGNTNYQTGNEYIAYCFAPVEGYSAFGSYTGNASAAGPFVHTGFRPALVIIKCSSTSNSYTNWDINDSARDTFNVADATLALNIADAENSANIGTQNIDFLSNGFKIRQATSSSKNLSGATYVWAAWAENPFQANGGLAR